MRWETQGGMPTKGLLYDQLREKLIECQEIAHMLGHVEVDNDRRAGKAWYKIGELLQNTIRLVTEIAQRGAQ